MNEASEVMVFGGSGSQALTNGICKHLGVRVCRSQVHLFSEGNTFVRVEENVRGRDVYIVQSTAFPVNDNFMELLFWIDAFKRASAATVTVVMPYFSYAKGDKKDEPRVSIRARVCADAIEVAGADRVVTMDLHAPQIQGFFKIPVDDLYALPTLCDKLLELDLPDIVVVAPDAGFAKKARMYADYLGTSLAIGDKSRKRHDEKAEVMEIIGNVKGKTAVLVDDFTISAGTLISAADMLLERGARSVAAMVSHGVFNSGALDRIAKSHIEHMLVTDSIEQSDTRAGSKLQVVSVAPLFADAIRRIHDRKSISVLFSFAGEH